RKGRCKVRGQGSTRLRDSCQLVERKPLRRVVEVAGLLRTRLACAGARTTRRMDKSGGAVRTTEHTDPQDHLGPRSKENMTMASIVVRFEGDIHSGDLHRVAEIIRSSVDGAVPNDFSIAVHPDKIAKKEEPVRKVKGDSQA